MAMRFLQRPGRLVSVRLTAWYCGLFSLSLGVLFAFVYWTLNATLRKTDEELLHSKVKEFADAYRNEGIDQIRKNASQKRSDTYLVRVSDGSNRTLFASLPEDDDLGPSALKALEKRPIAPLDRWIPIPLGAGESFDFANTRLPNGLRLQVGRNTLHRRELLGHFVRSCAAVTLPVLLLALGGGALISNRALRPLQQLNATVQNIVATGKMDARISPRRTAGELRDLVIAFNLMLEKIEGLVSGMRGVLDNVAHDLRTPITRLRGIAEQALRHPADTVNSQEALADCIEESERVITLLNSLMDISEVETGAMKLDLRRIDLAALAAQLTEFYGEAAQEKSVAITMAPAARCEVMADENRVRQALANLLDNAVKYTPAGGQVEVAVRAAGGQAVVSVRDSGIGIPEAELARIWERLYRSDKSRSQRGLGLGLSLVRAIAQAHGGECRVTSGPGAGSEFTLQIPLAA